MAVFSFGIAATVERLSIVMAQLRHWLPRSRPQVHVYCPENSGREALQAKAREAGINMTLTPLARPFAVAYFSLIKNLYERGSHTKWLVLLDDDSFVPSLPCLARHISRKYDSAKPHLIAAMLDNLGQILSFGLLPYGGGGIFISVPLAAQLVRVPGEWDDCLAAKKDQGDQLVNDCLNQHSTTRPTFDRTLNPMDIHGDASGYFESGRQGDLLTVHHWRSWYNVDVVAAAHVSHATGPESIFQRWLFDNDTVLSNGYSVAEYSRIDGDKVATGITEDDLGGVEYTWNHGREKDRWRYFHRKGPLRPMKANAAKRSLRLESAIEAVAEEGMGVRKLYVDRAGVREREEGEGEAEGVVETKTEDGLEMKTRLMELWTEW